MNNLRVYIAISTFYPFVGGAETQALAQSRILRERGYESTVVTFRHSKAWLPYEELDGIPVIRVAGTILQGREKLPRVFRQILYMLALVVMGWTLWKHRHRYDLLHVYQLSALALPTALASRLSGKPMMIAVRSTGSGKINRSYSAVSLIAGPLDKAASWLQVDGVSWVDGDLDGLVRMGKPIMRYTYALLRKINAKVIVLSTRMKGYLAAHDFILPNMQLIPNGVDIVRFSPSSQASPDARAQTVVCVSKLRYEKGIDVLLQAWYLVQKQMPQARLILVGNGPLQSQLVRMANELGIAESIEFAGLQRDVPSQIQRAGIAVLPSRWEGMPNAVLEAMACGIPCVATRVSGSEDIIEHGVNGLLVDLEDYAYMAQALLTLLRDPELTRKYGSMARATIEKHYSLEHITDSYLKLYFSMVGYQQQAVEEYTTI